MNPADTAAALGVLCGQGHLMVRHGEEWTEIRAKAGWDDQHGVEVLFSSADLLRLLTADEVR